ncbi:MAG TPA: ATP-binding protein [Bryobacteraceae bacterium]|nr:ATP-binding protein [Bryobacteraceae bacterium]
MMGFRFSRLSLLWKILLSTSVAITLLFGLTGWIVQHDAIQTTSQSVEDEVKASFQAYTSLWRARADFLSSVSLLLSTMSDVRAAFSTGDQATIRDTASELWSKISDESAFFLVTDAGGRVLAALGGVPEGDLLPRNVEELRLAEHRFPQQAAGFAVRQGRLYHFTVTPVYVQTEHGTALLNALVAGYNVDALVANRLKEATGGSEFLFLSHGHVIASTLNPRATREVANHMSANSALRRVSDGVNVYAPLVGQLTDVEGKPVAQLIILRSFEAVRQRIAALRRNVILLWLLAMSTGLALTYLLARKIVEPVKELDRAAAEVSRQNYDYQVKVTSEDELGRLAGTFNNMCESIRDARQELIRQERISTIGRLSSSIVHDLRNPLAAIYGGAEMLVDTDLSTPPVKRLAGNIYRASRRIQELLQDLLNVSRGKGERLEPCRLREVAAAACEALAATAEAQSVRISLDIPEDLELPLERSRIERVFSNLVGNALEAMPSGGEIRIAARVEKGSALIEVHDNGPGIAPAIRASLFQPFVSSGKKNGLGLGLALSRQSVLDHGGDMWVESEPGQGACFHFRLPLVLVPSGGSH